MGRDNETSRANLKKPWDKGESGNPSGRPKGALGRATIARYWLEAKTAEENKLTGDTEVLSQEDLITLAIIQKAKTGDVQAYRELLNSAYGQATQPITLDTDYIDLSDLTTDEIRKLLAENESDDSDE
jgi:hypothetical protein